MKLPLTLLTVLLLFRQTIFAEVPAQKLAPVLQSIVEKNLAAGVVALVADKERVLTLETAGYASLADKTPMREDAMFWIASMSKSMTATALMMLVDEGKVSLDNPVEKFLPEFKGQQLKDADGQLRPPKHPITVRELMNHTSGLATQSARQPLEREPGTIYKYANSGINVGGRIIEVVSGMSYADFMQTRLFDPLGMKDTTAWPTEEQASRLAHTARMKADKSGLEQIVQDQNVKPELLAKLSAGVTVPKPVLKDMGMGIVKGYANRYAQPAGGYFSTAHDVGRFCRMLLRGGELDGKRYLSDKAVRTMSAIHTGDAPVSPREAYGIGWSVKLGDDEGPSAGSFGHRGARRTAMWIDPKNGLAMIMLVERYDMSQQEQKVMYGDFLRAAVKTWQRKQP
jgi:CubicO group peptidase (beta-lactamase class C family)